MDPIPDIIRSLLETPFSWLDDNKRKDIVKIGRPTPSLNFQTLDKRHGETFSRTFKTHWYGSRQWLCGSSFKQALFCWPCLLLGKARNNVWVSQGYSDMKNLSAGVKKHELSREHMRSFLSLKKLEKDTRTVQDDPQMQSSLTLKLLNEEIRKNRRLMSYLIDVTCFLAKQEISFLGHNENSDSFDSGNFNETFDLLVKRDAEIQNHLKKIDHIFSGLSETIQNDLISCISEHLTDKIHAEIKESLFFAVQVDDTTEILEKSQCAISIRYVNKQAEIREVFLGFYDVSEDRKADPMYDLIKSVLQPFDYRKKLVGQCYDGASVMVGSLNGLQKKIKDDAPAALFTHCYAHRLTLVLQGGLRNMKNCRIYFATVTSISGFFHQSAKRTFILDSILQNRIPSSSDDNRWTSKSNIIQVIDSDWSNIKNVFSKIIDDKNSSIESVNGARGYFQDMNSLEFSFLTTVFKNIFDITDPLFDILQKNSIDVDYCKNQIISAQERIKSLMSEDFFNIIFEKAQSRIGLDEVDIQHSKRIRLSDSDVKDDERLSSIVSFYEIIENIVSQLDIRFADMSELLYFSLVDSSKFKAYTSNFPTVSVDHLTKFYKNMFDKQQLISELTVIYQDEDFSKLPNIASILKHFVIDDLQKIFPEAYKLFTLTATIPSTSISVEGHSSCFKRVKTYCQNSKKNHRLSSLALLSIEKELFCSLQKDDDFMDQIINKFVVLNNPSISLIYKI
ncbi:zinc finger MYM-type protein 1-like [Harmonia axyridis]|uniref:zinc finger MYM-type protein 1-like n=1 Tax=Harmonia axyridis TaxID=115357 RepID=UPI001E276AD8|nr:zinc finger MYM-type protein 1-like [Harmonia axyridis]